LKQLVALYQKVARVEVVGERRSKVVLQRLELGFRRSDAAVELALGDEVWEVFAQVRVSKPEEESVSLRKRGHCERIARVSISLPERVTGRSAFLGAAGRVPCHY
jgi:hypothetical protein